MASRLRRPTPGDFLEAAIAALAGFAVVVLPVVLDPNRRRHDAAFLPLVGDAVEGFQAISMVYLACVGFLMGLVGRGPVWLIGPATMLAFPLWSAIDMLAGSDSHNLLPFEWCIYVGLSLLGLAGAFLGRLLQLAITRIVTR